MQRKQSLIAVSLAALGIALAVFASTFLFASLCRLRFAENLILREEPRAESAWELRETPSGHLIRMQHGTFAGWYLAADELVNFTDAPAAVSLFTVSFGFNAPPSPHARCLILRERKGADCYWDLAETENGIHLRPARGRYAGWYLGLLEDYVPETGSNPRAAWNLILTREPVAGAVWKLARTPDGHLLQATAARTYQGWYLDCLHDAKVLERNRCWGEAATRDRPAPPLAR